jgi:hypothetical protein
MKKIAKILTLSAFLLAASNVNAQDVLNKSIADLNRMYPNRLEIPSNVALNLFQKGSGAISVDISQFSSGSDLTAQDRDFTQDESMTERADIQDPNTLQNTSQESSTSDISADTNSTDHIKKDADLNSDISSDSNVVKKDFVLEKEQTDQQPVDQSVDLDQADTTSTEQKSTERERFSKD